MIFLYYSSHSQVNMNKFKKYKWDNFYRGTKEAIPPNTPEERFNPISISALFVDIDHTGKRNRSIQTGILIFCNKYLINWYSKHQARI